MPIKTSNNTSITKIYGKTAGKHLSQSAIPPINFHSNTDNISYNLSGNMTQASTQEYSITDIPPIDFMSDGNGLSAYSIYGNMVQTGTPTPDAPIMPVEVGDRTGNLFDYTLSNFVYSTSNGSVITSNRYVSTDKKPVMSLSEMTISFNCPKEGTTASSDPDCFVYFWQDTTYLGYAQQYTKELVNVQIPPNATHFAFSVGAGSGGVLYIDDITNVMTNIGSTALPYAPYGYCITLSL